MDTFETVKQHTPCFLIDEEILKTNLNAFSIALEKYWGNFIFGYSVKTNSLPYLLNYVRQYGCHAEVVSDTEYALAQRIGFSPEHIIFNGPIKSHDQFLYAIQHGSIVNIDSAREIKWLAEANTLGIPISIGLRVSFNLPSVCPEESNEEGYSNRFGFNVENGYFQHALSEIRQLENVSVTGLHMHTNSKSRSPKVFSELSRQACFLTKQYDLKLSYVDIGGSFFMGKNNLDAPDTYIAAITQQLLTTFDPKETVLMIEPGAALISTPIQYLTQVIDVKDTYRDHFIITDGGRLHVDPFLRKTRLDYVLITTSDASYERQVICGFSCMDTDRIMTLSDAPMLSVGDYILYSLVGSYTMCFNSLFIEYLPPVYIKKEDGYMLVREKWGIDEYLQKNNY